MDFDTFQNESKIISDGEVALEQQQDVDFRIAYRTLLDEYKKLTKTSRRLVRISDRSEEKLRETNDALIVARDEAEAAKEETRQFLAMISHELRTPLAILKSEIELISDGIRQPTEENLASLQEEIDHFSRLINDMFELSLSDIQALKYEKKILDLGDLLEKSIQQFEPIFTTKKLNIDYLSDGQAMRIFGDAQRIRQVFANILKNSYNYTHAKGILRVNSYLEDGKCVIEFSDSAPGLDDDALDKIFQRFFRGESSRNRATGGAGLGMAICTNIVTEHAGNISAEHSNLGGICIRLIFPSKE